MKCVEFMGMPKSGKTTQLELLETILKHEKKYNVRGIFEGARISPLDKDDRFLYNTWSFHNTTNKIMEARNKCCDYVLVDRGVYDHLAFTDALYKSGDISKKQWQSQIKYFNEFTNLHDCVFVFMLSPLDSMERENKNHMFSGRVMNMDFLSKLHDSYQEIIPKINRDYYVVDGGGSLGKNGEGVLGFLESRFN